MTAEIDPTQAQGRLKELVPIAVIDIGSNSVRQVIYEGLTRAPTVLFNEKVLCGLGKNIVTTGRLNEEGIKRSLKAIRRFVTLSRQLKVSKIHIVATAAAREAVNGPEFIKNVESIAECKVEVLSGAKEAEYSAMGVKSGFYKPSGIVGDMGGGSLELVSLGKKIGEGFTLPLGGLRLVEMANGSLEEARKIARAHLEKVNIKWPGKDKNFYAIGGTWRSLGKLHIANHDYPLLAVHDYELPAAEMIAFCEQIIKSELSEMKGINAVSKNRRDLLPVGAVVMCETLRALGAENVLLSSLGLREGVLYSMLSRQQQKMDSLLTAAREFSILRARAPEHCLELADWTGKAFKELGISESEDDSRHRIAACYLADIAWRAHPDFRAQQYMGIIANAGFVGISHEGRAYLTLANYHRYLGLNSRVKPPEIAKLASPDTQKKARILGAMFRVLYLFSATTPKIIPQLTIKKIDAGNAVITIPRQIAGLQGERPAERIRQLGKELAINVKLKVVKD